MAPPPQDVILVFGDSRVDVPNAGPNITGEEEGYLWLPALDPDDWYATTNAIDLWWPILNDYWKLETGRTLGIIQGGATGTRTDQWRPDYDEFGHPNFYDNAIAQWENAGSPTPVAVLIVLGPNDVQASGTVSTAQHEDDLEAILAGIAADVGGSVPVYHDIFADKGATGYVGGVNVTTDPQYRADMDKVRLGTLNVIDAQAILHLGANLTGQVYATDDHTHPHTLGLVTEIAQGFFLALQGGIAAPRKTGVTINVAGTRVTVNVSPSLGTSGAVGGFRVMDDGTAVTITSATASAGGVVLELAAPIAGTCTVSFGSGADCRGVTMPKGATQNLPDASTYAAPLVPFFASAVTLEAPRCIFRAS